MGGGQVASSADTACGDTGLKFSTTVNHELTLDALFSLLLVEATTISGAKIFRISFIGFIKAIKTSSSRL